MSHRVLLIGRDATADIILDDASVSRLHAELVLGTAGEIYLIDRSSRAGTSRQEAGGWQPVRQTAVRAEDLVRFGDFEVRVDTLLDQVPRSGPSSNDDLPQGQAVRRDPVSGQVISE